jgi:hypothetical protein
MKIAITIIGLLLMSSSLILGQADKRIAKRQAKKSEQMRLNSMRYNTVIKYNDTIYYNGVKHMILKESGSYGYYNIYDMNGTHIFRVQRFQVQQGGILGVGVNYSEFTYIGNEEQKAYARCGEGYTEITRHLVNNEVVAFGTFNEGQWEKYRKINPRPNSEESLVDKGVNALGESIDLGVKKLDQAVNNPNPNPHQIVRNKTANLLVVDRDIYQDGKVIGTFKMENQQEGMDKYRAYTVFFKNGKVCASIRICDTNAAQNSKVAAVKDGKVLLDESKNLEALLTLLVDNNYL